MQRFENQAQPPLLLWSQRNPDSFFHWQAQVHCSWIMKALIQTLFQCLWSVVWLAVSWVYVMFWKPELYFSGKIINNCAQHWKVNFFNWFLRVYSQGKWKQNIPDSGHSLCCVADAFRPTHTSKLFFRMFLCRYRSTLTVWLWNV